MAKEATKRSFLVRRALAVLMVVMLIVSIVAPHVVWAEETNTTTNGYYDASGEWHQGGNGVFEYPEANLTLSKTAKPIEGKNNVFEIILKVTTKQSSSVFNPSSLATVLIIDCSGSMQWCEECGGNGRHSNTCSYYSEGIYVMLDQTRIYAAKQAAIAFLDAMREDAKEGSGRYVTLVSFANDATNSVATWQDVTTTDGYNTVVNAIGSLSANGGTNLDDALGHAAELISDEKLSTMSKGGKNVVVLTDGTPTFYVTPEGYRGGDSLSCTKTLLDDTILAATALREKTNVFTVCYDAASTATYSGGPTVGDFLENSVASPATNDIKYAYNVSNADELIDSFMDIVDTELEAAQITITDPIPENIVIPDGGLPDGIKYENGVWSLHGVEPDEEINGDTATYTYTITYKVEIDPYAAGMEEGQFYPANKPTHIIMSDDTTYEFPVPGIMPIPQKFDITYNSGDHGSIEGEDANGNVTFEDVIKGKDTPDAPEVTPDDGWYFVGWTPEISDTVEEDVTYIAIYSQKQVITVTGNSGSATYNGTEQSVSGFVVTGLPQGWTVSGITHSVSGINASATPYEGTFSGTPVVMDENNAVVPEGQYALVLTNGTLTIEKRDLTITADSNSKEYDGTALTDNGYEDTAPVGLVNGDIVDRVTVAGSQTLVGQSANVASGAVIMNGNADVTSNYNITYVDGILTVGKKTDVLVITANSASKIYDATPLTDSGYTYTQGILASGDVLTVTVQGSQTDAGTGANQVVSWSVMRGDTPVTQYYNIVCVDGTLEVTKRDLTITADSASKVYDGTALTDSGWKDTAPVGLAYGDTITSVTVTGSQTNVGQSANVASDAVIVRNTKDVTNNYNITYVDGTLTVNTVGTPITITANSNSKIYDGLPLEDGGFIFTQGVLAQGDVLMVTVQGSQTDAGTGVNTVVSYKVMRDGVDITDFYTFTTPVDGTLTVEKRDLTIAADSASKEYDGTELTDGGWQDTPPVGLATTDEIEYVAVIGGQTDVGSSANVASGAVIMRGNENATDNYNVTYVNGTLTVTKNTQVITITAESDSKVYDGTPLTNDGYTFTDGIIAQGDELIVEVEGSQTYVGSRANKVVSYKVMRGNEDVTSYYTFATPVDGTLTVTKAEGEIIVTAGSASKEYDGTPLTSDDYTLNQDILADGDELVVVTQGSQSYVGSSANKVVSIKVIRDGVDVTDNYNIGTPIDGVLEITGKSDEITIIANSDSKEYDGTPLTNDGYTVSGALANGDELVVVVEGSQTNAGSSANTVVSVKVMRGGVDVTENYSNLNSENGTLTVTKAEGEIIVTAGSASKEYDGTPLTSDDYTLNQDILADGDELVVVTQGSQTYVGSSANKVVSIKVIRDGVDVTDNYNIGTSVDGVLEITAKANTITITAVSDSKEYDGTALVNGGYSFTKGILADGDVLTVDVNGSQTFVGTGVNEIASYKVMRGDKDVTANYSIVTVNGTLEVTKRELIITADSASKIYDGTPLTDNGWNDTAPAGLADGDAVASVTVTGSQTNVGQSANVASGAVVMRGNKDVTANYNIAYVNGTLTVSAVGTPIIITAASDSKIYDGSALTNGGFAFTQGVLAQGDELVVVVEGSQTNAGISANKVVSYKVMRAGVDITSFYTFATPVDGVLEVTKRDVTITVASDSKEYDGTPLENSSFTANGIVTGEYINSVTVVGSQLFAGSSSNVASGATIMSSGKDVTANYNITYVDGTLTVTKKTDEITITANSDSKEYDGAPLTNDGFTVTGTLANGDEIVAVIEGSQTVVGSSPNVVVSIKVIRDGVDVTENYENLIPADGTLTVEKIGTPLVVTASSNTKIYDGIPLTDGTYTFTDGVLIEGDELVVVIEGSQTEVGSSVNKVVSVKVMRGETDVTDNYNIELPVDGELVVTPVVPETGDNTNITVWNVMMLVSLLTLFVLAFTSRRKQRAR